MTEELVNNLLNYADYLVTQDETELALKVLDCVPAYYRDHKLKPIEKLRSEILGKMLLVTDHVTDVREEIKSIGHSVNYMERTARGMVLYQEVKKANEQNEIPYIVDFGPGDATFAIAMAQKGLSFYYNPISLNTNFRKQIREHLGDKIRTERPVGSPYYFCGLEIIEHLADITEIRQAHDRLGIEAQKIFLSTPKYTFGTGTINWRTEMIHHRRAYTPGEFIAAAKSLWPLRTWFWIDDPVQVLISDTST